MSSKARVVIAGGGIGGLTAAVALIRQGCPVEVLERAPALEPVGAGITLQINAMRVLARLGLEEQVLAKGAVPVEASVLKPSGAVISTLDLARISRALGAPSVCIHRAALQAILLEAVGDTRLRLGTEVRGFEEKAQSVAVHTRDGRRLEADALIGADGIHSAVRSQLHGAVAPEYAGYTCWRGICDNEGISDPTRVTETWGKGARMGLVPIGEGKLYWFAVVNAPAHGRDGPDLKAELLSRFGGWHPEVPRAIQATPADRIFRDDLHDRPPLPRWGQGRVTLLGDAAHPMTPNLGQGACMAIEDGWVLAACLGEEPDVAKALRRYESRRLKRTASTVRLARRMGKMGQWSNGLARGLRDALVRITPRSVAERQVRGLLDFRG